MIPSSPKVLCCARHHFRVIACIAVVLFGIGNGAYGTQSVYLTWNPSTSSNVASYKVYFGTQSGVYPNAIAFGVTNSATIPGLAAGVTYYFGVTAVTTNGNESLFSNEAIYTPPNTGTTISLSAQASTQALAAVQLTWTASAGADVYGYSINYWTPGSDYTNSYGFYGVTNGLISGLTTGTTYLFSVSPIDSYGVEAVASSVVSYTVPNQPTITLQAQPAINTAGVQLSWNMIQNAGIAGYNAYYGPDPATSSQNYYYSVNCGTTNKAVIQGLTAGQTYYFVVTPVDTYGNVGSDSLQASAVPSLPAPIKFKVGPTTNALNSVNVSWSPSSDPTVTGYAVYYGTDNGNDQYFQEFWGVTNALITGLTPGTLYYFALAPMDSFGLEAISSGEVSNTVAMPTPIVLRTRVQSTNTPGVALSWNAITNGGIAYYQVYYGQQSNSFDSSVTCDSSVTNTLIQGLNGKQTYYFAVQAMDSYGDPSPYSNEASAVAPNPLPMKLQCQAYYDGNGNVYAIEVNTLSAVFGNWEVDSTTDFQNWTPVTTGYGYGNGNGYDVDAWVYIDPTQPPMFFRAFNY